MPWSKCQWYIEHVCPSSSAEEKHAPLKKVFGKKSTQKLLKEFWFHEECKSLQCELQTAYENFSLNSLPALPEFCSLYSKVRNKLYNVLKKKQDVLLELFSLH